HDQIRILFLLSVLLFITCKDEVSDQITDRILYNADVYTVDETSEGNFIAIKDGRIVAVGKDDYKAYQGKYGTYRFERQFVMPEFIEGHGHFSGLDYVYLISIFKK
ncbi:MAG: hypothetical protein IPN72_22605, partial [Saprospiraceae bacterium]|nr:hypothetical protein [Saprospiraceae bacterium]